VSTRHGVGPGRGLHGRSYQLDTAREPRAYLLGVPPMEDYLSFLIQASPGENPDMAAAGRRWRQAAEVWRELTSTEAGAADSQPVDPLPETLAGRASAFLETPAVATSYVTSSPLVAAVPLDGLVVSQRFVNLDYAEQLRGEIGQLDPSIGSESMFDFCMAIGQPSPPLSGLQASGSTFVFSSRSADARFLGARLVEAGSLQGPDPGGRPVSAVVLYVGYGTNALTVVELGGRLLLSNGGHRCYALKAAGATHAIAVVQHLSTRDELSVVPAVQQSPAQYLDAPRPPMLKDFFDERLVDVLQAPRRLRQISIQFGMQQGDAPG
jgi:hypothetical protein